MFAIVICFFLEFKTRNTLYFRPYLYGPTSMGERLQILQNFQHNPKVNTIFVSKVTVSDFQTEMGDIIVFMI